MRRLLLPLEPSLHSDYDCRSNHWAITAIEITAILSIARGLALV